jgi:glycosyltransferase involved in cell wall biosynthesis
MVCECPVLVTDKIARMKIMLIISSLGRGGAERVMSVLANHWVGAGHRVSLVTLAARQMDEYRLHPDIKRIVLDSDVKSKNLIRGVMNNCRRIRQLRLQAKHIRPDIVVSFVAHANLLALLALPTRHIPVIVSERADPSQINIGWFRTNLRKLLYPLSAAVVVQTDDVRLGIQHSLGKAHIAVIPNPVTDFDPDDPRSTAPLRTLVPLPANAKIISAMGRLDYGKGFDLLVEAFNRIHRRYPDWHLVIFGNGMERANLERQVAGLGLGGRIHLPGAVSSPRRLLSEADLFVLSSRFEGFPNALLEAMVCGLAVVSFDCPSGPRDIIRDGKDGLLVPREDVSALANAMSVLMSDAAVRQRLGVSAREVAQRFSLERIAGLWEVLLGAAAQRDTPSDR